MLSLDQTLTHQKISNIVAATAEKIGNYTYNSIGRTLEVGYGRINAYQALLLTHAYSNKSMATTATASNNGRRMVIGSNGNYHLVFESGVTSGGNVLSEIYYRSSSDGIAWGTPVRLSAGNEQNRYPSIVERSNKLYVVWQRKTGSNTYDILFRHFNGTSWESIRTVKSGISATSDPIPVIAVSQPSYNFEMMAIYRTNGGLKSRRSTSINGSTWETEMTVTTNSSAANPSLPYPLYNSYFRATWHAGGHIYSREFQTYGWGSAVNLSSGLGSTANTHEYSSFAVSNSYNLQIVWQATDPALNKKVIFHNRDLNTTIYTKFYNSNANYLRPSVSGMFSSGSVVLWHDDSGNKNIRKAQHNGSSWQDGATGTIHASNGMDTSVASRNPAAPPVKAVWRSTGTAPFTLNTGSALQKGSESDVIVYSRQLIYALDSTAVLALRLFAPQIGGESLAFPEVSDKDSLITESLAETVTFDFVVPEKAEEAKLNLEVFTTEANNLLQSGESSLQIGLELIDTATNARVALTTTESLTLFGEAQTKTNLSLPLTQLRGKTVRIRPVLTGLDFKKVRGALVHEYGSYPIEGQESQPPTVETAINSNEIALSAFPNPFNPATQIRFTLPAAGAVSLRVFDIRGRLVREWKDEPRSAGENTITWDGHDQRGTQAASGTYFAELTFDKLRKVTKMTLVR